MRKMDSLAKGTIGVFVSMPLGIVIIKPGERSDRNQMNEPKTTDGRSAGNFAALTERPVGLLFLHHPRRQLALQFAQQATHKHFHLAKARCARLCRPRNHFGQLLERLARVQFFGQRRHQKRGLSPRGSFMRDLSFFFHPPGAAGSLRRSMAWRMAWNNSRGTAASAI